MCPGHSSRETEGLRVSSGSLRGLLGRTTALSPGPRCQASALPEPRPSPAASASWQRHSRPGHSRAAWSLSLGWPGVDTRTGSKPQGAASHPICSGKMALTEAGSSQAQEPQESRK